jgi:3-oxoacyl-[acyl-carrier protein] reductase
MVDDRHEALSLEPAGPRLRGRTALVTGAARGIGRAIALRYAAEGASLVLVDVQEATELCDALRKAGSKALSYRVDITDAAAVEDMVADAVGSLGSLDILVNNAGIITRGSFADLTLETWKKVLDVNLNGNFNCCKAVVPHMVRNGYGRIVNISSIAGKIGDVTAAPAYGTSKGAVNAFTKSLARELARFGITVNAIAPHAIETEMSAQWSAEKRAAIIDSIPLKRLGKPQEVAEAAVFLASEGAGFITGEVMDMNGGFLMD